MSEKIFDEDEIWPMLLILYILGLVNLIYLLLLFLLDTIGGETGAPNSSDPLYSILPAALAIGAAIALLILSKFFLPKVDAAESANEAFPAMLMGSVLVEVIGIFGLFIGLIDIFVLEGSVRWFIVVPFMIISLLIQLYLVENNYKRKLNDLVGTTYTIQN